MEDSYLALASFPDGRHVEGWINNFKPTAETPDVISHVRRICKKQGFTPTKIDILAFRKPDSNGR